MHSLIQQILNADFESGTLIDIRDKTSNMSLLYVVDSQIRERNNPLSKWINKIILNCKMCTEGNK